LIQKKFNRLIFKGFIQLNTGSRYFLQLYTEYRVLQALLLLPAGHINFNFNLRDIRTDHMSYLTRCNFIIQMLFLDVFPSTM